MNFHPAAQIVTWCLLAAILQSLSLGVLLASAGLVFLFAILHSARKLWQLLRRTRWIMLSLMLVYAYTTPGQPLLDALGILSPSREGLGDGVLQLTRLLSALAGLAILLDRLHRQQLIAGLYTLLVPLKLIGVSRDRVAVRLALTLHYAEVAMLRQTSTWQDSLRSLFEAHGEDSKHMELALYRFRIQDVLLVSFALLLCYGALR
ncbi:MAG TPA: CbiQ family ECF transporter T component [Gallionella sp.]|nr:CbiQ family ECF transporter T component [Gallionella sp.]